MEISLQRKAFSGATTGKVTLEQLWLQQPVAKAHQECRHSLAPGEAPAQPQTHQDVLCLHLQLLLPWGLSPTAAVTHCTQAGSFKTQMLWLLDQACSKSPILPILLLLLSCISKVTLVDLQNGFQASIYLQHLDNFSPVLYLCHLKLMILHTKGLRPDVKSADKIFRNTNSQQVMPKTSVV